MTEDELAYFDARRKRIADKQKAYKDANREKVRAWNREYMERRKREKPEAIKEAQRRYRLKDPKQRQQATLEWAHGRPGIYLFYNAKYRAQREGIPFTIEKSDVVIPEFCPVLGIAIDPAKRSKGCLPNSPSLDKIIPELGYVPGNVQVISHRANSIKRDATADELYKVARWVEAETARVRAQVT